MGTNMFSYDSKYGLYPPGKNKDKSPCFRCEHPQNRVSISPIMIGWCRGDLQLNMNSKPFWGPDIPHLHKVFDFVSVDRRE